MRLQKLKSMIARGDSKTDLIDEIIRLENENICDHWDYEDIVMRGSDIGYIILKGDAMGIARQIEKGFDAEIGINWDTIDHHIDTYFEGRK